MPKLCIIISWLPTGPFGEIKETIGGFIVVKAESIDEAAEFAKGCPVLQSEGNTMEVRKIAKRDGIP